MSTQTLDQLSTPSVSGDRVSGSKGLGRLVAGSPRDLGTVAVVAGLVACYAAVMVMTGSVLGTLAGDAPGSGFLKATMTVMATVFIGIALYVAVVVIGNAIDAVISGRLQQIALLRLLGSRSRDLRRAVVLSACRVGLAGAVVGTVVGVLISAATRSWLVRTDRLPADDYAWVSPGLALSVVAIAAAAALAGRFGARAVLSATPAQAMTGVSAPAPANRRTSGVRAALATLIVAVGLGLLALAALLGEQGSTWGFVVAFLGSVAFGTGLLIGARLFVPRAVSLVGRLWGRGPASDLARRNAIKDPLRTTRSTMGLVIGVALVATIASGSAALKVAVPRFEGITPEQVLVAHRILDFTEAVLLTIVLISAVIASVGFASVMSLTVLQRRRELGLLRALGFTSREVRSMITREAAALTVAATLVGVLVGVFFGAVGAQSVVGQYTPGIAVAVPWAVLGVIAVAATALTLASSLVPARRAVAVPPIEALRLD